MITLEIQLATNKIPKDIQDIISDHPAIMEVCIKPDFSDDAKIKTKEYVDGIKQEIEMLECEWLYHENEAFGAKALMKEARKKYDELQKMFER